MYQNGLISASMWEELEPLYATRIEEQTALQRDLLQRDPSLLDEERMDVMQEGLRAQRAMLTSLLSHGLISETIFGELVQEVDADLIGKPLEAMEAQEAAI